MCTFSHELGSNWECELGSCWIPWYNPRSKTVTTTEYKRVQPQDLDWSLHSLGAVTEHNVLQAHPFWGLLQAHKWS